jgi:hypothetical protein
VIQGLVLRSAVNLTSRAVSSYQIDPMPDNHVDAAIEAVEDFAEETPDGITPLSPCLSHPDVRHPLLNHEIKIPGVNRNGIPDC